MRALLDTCVISEINRRKGSSQVKERIAAMDHDELFLSVITIGEIAKGVGLAKPKDRGRYEDFLRQLERQYGSRILELDIDTANIWGEITAKMQIQGMTLPACDGLIAATAIRHGLPVLTRNTGHFEATGAMFLNPWEETKET